MSATRNEIAALGDELTTRHRHEALALASMIGFFFHNVPVAKHNAREFHMQTLWTCVRAEMGRLDMTRDEIMAAGASIKRTNETLAILDLLTD